MENFGPRHYLTKCFTTEPKLLILVSWHNIFSEEKLPHTLILVIATTHCGKYAVPFFMGHPLLNNVLKDIV